MTTSFSYILQQIINPSAIKPEKETHDEESNAFGQQAKRLTVAQTKKKKFPTFDRWKKRGTIGQQKRLRWEGR